MASAEDKAVGDIHTWWSDQGHIRVARRYAEAGFDHLVTMNMGPDPDGFIDFFARELAKPLRELAPAPALSAEARH